MQHLKLTFWLLLFVLCNKSLKAQENLPDVVGLLTPIVIQDSITEINLMDYFLVPENIVRIIADNAFQTSLSLNKKTLALRQITNPPILSNLEFYTKNGDIYSILVKTKKMNVVNFSIKDEGYNNVSVVGDMNAWSGKLGEMKKDSDVWKTTMLLGTGDYEYQFVADGINKNDVNNPLSSSNGKKSRIHIQAPDFKDLPQLYTSKFSTDSITIGIANSKPEQIYIYVENKLILHNVHRFGGNYNFIKNAFKFKIPTSTQFKKRTHIRVFSANGNGESNDILIPLEFGRVVDSSSKLDKTDAQSQVAYLALVDRFNDGNKRNNKPIRDKRVNPMSNWQGGDIAGIQNKIDEGYFDSLNINSLWISPITRNPDSAFLSFEQLALSNEPSNIQVEARHALSQQASSLPKAQHWSTGYHGFCPVVNNQIDPHFGTESEFKNMISAAHKKRLNVVMDYVANAVDMENVLTLAHPEFLTLPESSSSKKNIPNLNEELITTLFDQFLPSLKSSKPEIFTLDSDTTLFWLKKYDLDGFQYPGANQIPFHFWRELTRKIKLEEVVTGKKVFQIGESNESRFLARNYLNSGMHDAQIDLEFYSDAREALAKDTTSMTLISKALIESFNYFGYHSTMGNITGSHTQPRLISYAGSALSFSEDATEAAYMRKVGVGNPIGYKRLQMTTALICAIPGVPVIYYGDEIGIPGAGDPDNRRMMYFKKLTPIELETKHITEKVTHLRRQRLSLTYGDIEILLNTNNTLVIARTYFGEITIVAFNKSKKVQNLEFNIPWRFRNELFKSQFKNSYDVSKNEMTLQLRPVSFDFITN